jgi:K+-sensing histidine kinase KdpD
VAVQDSGPGVPDYALPRLGERFFTTARPNGERSGSGLGLAIVRQIMALHTGVSDLRLHTGFTDLIKPSRTPGKLAFHSSRRLS